MSDYYVAIREAKTDEERRRITDEYLSALNRPDALPEAPRHEPVIVRICNWLCEHVDDRDPLTLFIWTSWSVSCRFSWWGQRIAYGPLWWEAAEESRPRVNIGDSEEGDRS